MDGAGPRGNPGLPSSPSYAIALQITIVIGIISTGRAIREVVAVFSGRVLQQVVHGEGREIQCPALTPQLLSISMATARPAYTALTPDASSSPFPLSIPMEDLSTIHELPPENRSKTAHKRKLRHGISWRWDSARTLVSIFVDNNAGLMLVGASQFFLSAMNVAVKLLNGLDKPVPTLELIWVRMMITYICSIAYM